jgi:hypothetical protein
MKEKIIELMMAALYLRNFHAEAQRRKEKHKEFELLPKSSY